MALADRKPPTPAEYVAYRERFRNWGRWGADDQLGTLNHITPDVRRTAGALIREGRSVSLSHPLAKRAGPRNPAPVQHYMQFGGGGSQDYIGISFHGIANTHLDALCHVWAGPNGPMYNERPASDVTAYGARSNAVEAYRDGIVTRAVLYDIPRLRGAPYVQVGEPVHGWELQDAAKAQGVEPRAGDAVLIHSRLAAFLAAHPDTPNDNSRTPGVHASVLEFLFETSASLLVWDALDAFDASLANPPGWTRTMPNYPVHEIAIPIMGMPLLDNADLEPLARTCAELSRWECCLVVAPLVVRGGTGSPVNPIAIF